MIRGRPFLTKHGHASWQNKSATYKAWMRMRMRCRRHPHYLKHGIVVCVRWSKFENFLADMGALPPGKTLDRIDGRRGYSPDNCRWATKLEQANNCSRNIFATAFGETKTIAEWTRDPRCITGYSGLRNRIKRGVPPELAMVTANRKPCGVEESQ